MDTTTDKAKALEQLATRDDVMETVAQPGTEPLATPTDDAIEAGGTNEVTVRYAGTIAYKDGDTVAYVAVEPGQRVKVSESEVDRLKALDAIQS